MTCLKPQASQWWIHGSNLASWLQSVACNQQSKLVLLKVGCLEEQQKPGNLLEAHFPGGGASICV